MKVEEFLQAYEKAETTGDWTDFPKFKSSKVSDFKVGMIVSDLPVSSVSKEFFEVVSVSRLRKFTRLKRLCGRTDLYTKSSSGLILIGFKDSTSWYILKEE